MASSTTKMGVSAQHDRNGSTGLGSAGYIFSDSRSKQCKSSPYLGISKRQKPEDGPYYDWGLATLKVQRIFSS
jgi:hypothetical protein